MVIYMEEKLSSKEILRRNIKYYRKLNNITAEKLAEKLDLSHDFVRQVESEKIDKTFSVNSIEKVASVFNIEIMDLYNPDTANK